MRRLRVDQERDVFSRQVQSVKPRSRIGMHQRMSTDEVAVLAPPPSSPPKPPNNTSTGLTSDRGEGAS